MKKFKNPTILAIWYTAASVFLGPAILLLGYSFTRGGGDYCDAVYYLPDGSLDPRRIQEFHNAQIIQVVGASIMIALGLAIVLYSLRTHTKQRTRMSVGALLAVTCMILGYILVLLMSGKGGQRC